MPIIERPDNTRRTYIPPGIKLILLAAVILGFLLRSCWLEKREDYYEINNIVLADRTHSSVDVLFHVTNKTSMTREEPVLIKVYTTRGDVIASRLTNIEVQPRSRRRYRKMVEKWERPLLDGEELSHATIEIYKPSILGR